VKECRDEAYVLSTRALGETDLIVSLLAENHGQVRGVARSARRSRRRFGGLLEPLTHVRAVWVEKPGRELHRIEGLEGLRSFAEMQADPVRQAACAVLAEVSEVFCREGQAEKRSFKLLGAVLDGLSEGGDPWTMLRYFEYWTLRLHGVLPDVGQCGVCGRKLASRVRVRVGWRSGLHCGRCGFGEGELRRPFGSAERAFIRSAREQPPRELPARPAVARSGGGLEAFLRGTLETFAERRFRAYRYLRRVAMEPSEP
jgi:DNA repair protein RecO (recombination protein O)